MTVDLLLKDGSVVSEGSEQVRSVAVAGRLIQGIYNESDVTIIECDMSLAKEYLIEAIDNEDIAGLKMYTMIMECIKKTEEV